MDVELRFDRWYLPLSVPLGLGPNNSELRLDADHLHVKMGWAFLADIPLASITRAEVSDARVFEAGVHFRGSRWLVNGSRKGLVEFTIDPPAPVKFWRMSMRASTLVLSVTNPEALVAACSAAAR